MILHWTVIWEVYVSVAIATHCHAKVPHKHNGLEKVEEEEFCMIHFTNAATDPEAMMVELSDAHIAIMTMLGSIG